MRAVCESWNRIASHLRSDWRGRQGTGAAHRPNSRKTKGNRETARKDSRATGAARFSFVFVIGNLVTQRPHKFRILSRARRIVIKIGSSNLSDAAGVKRESIAQVSQALAALHMSGKEVVLV